MIKERYSIIDNTCKPIFIFYDLLQLLLLLYYIPLLLMTHHLGDGTFYIILPGIMLKTEMKCNRP